jgi:putative peptidoglycan lipid II flippase
MINSRAISLSTIFKGDNNIIWYFVFLYATIGALLVQLVFLPVLFPQWHAVDGLLIGGDWIAFHQKALELAKLIQDEGWNKWELRPNGWFPAGLASALYVIVYPLPLVLVPINAAVHATSTLALIKIMNIMSKSARVALYAAIPYTLFPTAMLWYTQIHRDGFYNLGILLFIYGFVSMIHETSCNSIIKKIRHSAVFLCGMILIWVVRPYSLIMVLYTGLFLLLIIAFVYALKVLQSKLKLRDAILTMLILSLLFFVTFTLYTFSESAKYLREIDSSDQKTLIQRTAEEKPEQFKWNNSVWVPNIFENQLYSVAYLRSVEFPDRYGETASVIDTDISFHSAKDFLIYLPRAFQISFFAPFPSSWFKDSGSSISKIFRVASGFEMMFFYLLIIPLIYSFWIWRKRIEFYTIVIFCSIMILPLVYSVPNLGTMYRYRFVYLMILSGLAVSALFTFLKSKLKKNEKKVLEVT